MDELKRPPIDAIIARGAAGSGQVELKQAVVQSPAFRADASGTIISISEDSTMDLNLASATGAVTLISETGDILEGNTEQPGLLVFRIRKADRTG